MSKLLTIVVCVWLATSTELSLKVWVSGIYQTSPTQSLPGSGRASQVGSSAIVIQRPRALSTYTPQGCNGVNG